MSSAHALKTFAVENAHVEVYATPGEMGVAAADRASAIISDALARQGKARLIVATGNSQIPMIDRLVALPLDWSRVEVFHMDEYVGIGADHPASFRHWIRTRFADKVHPGKVFYIAGDAADLDAEIERYAQLLAAEPIDAAFPGFGENGHIAFNDPPYADFNDPLMIKKVRLAEASRKQQVGEGHFPDLASVPTHAVTITCSGLFRAGHWICCVPEARKADAVRKALEGPITEQCPATLVRRHADARVFLDRDSASLLSQPAAV